MVDYLLTSMNISRDLLLGLTHKLNFVANNKVMEQKKALHCLSMLTLLIFVAGFLFISFRSESSPVMNSNGILFLNYDADSTGAPICDTPTRLFIAIESAPGEAEARKAARDT